MSGAGPHLPCTCRYPICSRPVPLDTLTIRLCSANLEAQTVWRMASGFVGDEVEFWHSEVRVFLGNCRFQVFGHLREAFGPKLHLPLADDVVRKEDAKYQCKSDTREVDEVHVAVAVAEVSFLAYGGREFLLLTARPFASHPYRFPAKTCGARTHMLQLLWNGGPGSSFDWRSRGPRIRNKC